MNTNYSTNQNPIGSFGFFYGMALTEYSMKIIGLTTNLVVDQFALELFARGNMLKHLNTGIYPPLYQRRRREEREKKIVWTW